MKEGRFFFLKREKDGNKAAGLKGKHLFKFLPEVSHGCKRSGRLFGGRNTAGALSKKAHSAQLF